MRLVLLSLSAVLMAISLSISSEAAARKRAAVHHHTKPAQVVQPAPAPVVTPAEPAPVTTDVARQKVDCIQMSKALDGLVKTSGPDSTSYLDQLTYKTVPGQPVDVHRECYLVQ
jgi:hypothetical protein